MEKHLHVITLRVTDAQARGFHRYGGSAWLRRLIDECLASEQRALDHLNLKRSALVNPPRKARK